MPPPLSGCRFPAMLTDTHCHLAAPQLALRLPEIFRDAQAAGVSGFIVPAAQRQDWAAVLALRTQAPVRAVAVGIHPWFAEQAQADDFHTLAAKLAADCRLLVGEIGLDFHGIRSGEASRQTQIKVWEAQLALARQHRRPIILHNLKAAPALWQSIRKTAFDSGGIVHAFSGSPEEAQTWIRQGFLIGIGSLLLNPNARKVRRAAAALPADSLLLETDSPFMLHGQTNTPANLHRIAAVTAQLRGITLPELAAQCEQNLNRLLAQTETASPS